MELASLEAVVSVAEAVVSEAEVEATVSEAVEEAAAELDGLAVPSNWN